MLLVLGLLLVNVLSIVLLSYLSMSLPVDITIMPYIVRQSRLRPMYVKL